MEFDIEGMSREELEERLRTLLYVRDRVAQNARLLQELHQQKQELEDQNRLLSEAQSDAEAARSDYVELYDFAPMAYYLFDNYGCVRGVNLTGASMLGQERERLLGRPFALLIGAASAPAFWAHLSACRKLRAAVESELSLSLKRGELAVRCVSVPVVDLSGNTTMFRTVFTDIADLEAARQNESLARDSERRQRATYDRVQHAALHVHRLLQDASGLDLDPWCQGIVEEARLLSDAEHALLTVTAYPGIDGIARFTSGAFATGARDSQVIHQTIQYLDHGVGELCLTTRRPHGFSAEDRLRMALFAEALGSSFELARYKWLARAGTPQSSAAPILSLAAPTAAGLGLGQLRRIKL